MNNTVPLTLPLSALIAGLPLYEQRYVQEESEKSGRSDHEVMDSRMRKEQIMVNMKPAVIEPEKCRNLNENKTCTRCMRCRMLREVPE